jgi:hypothetical protein
MTSPFVSPLPSFYSDEEWAELVLSLTEGVSDEELQTSATVLEQEVRSYVSQIEYVPERYVPDFTWGANWVSDSDGNMVDETSGLSDETILAIRKLHAEGPEADEISGSTGLDYPVVVAVLEGQIAPYLGKLSKPRNYHGFKFVFPPNGRHWERFSAACIWLAAKSIAPAELNVILKQAGQDPDILHQIFQIKVTNERRTSLRYHYLRLRDAKAEVERTPALRAHNTPSSAKP